MKNEENFSKQEAKQNVRRTKIHFKKRCGSYGVIQSNKITNAGRKKKTEREKKRGKLSRRRRNVTNDLHRSFQNE